MQEAQLVAIVEPILADHGLELDHLAVTPLGRRKLLRITVDGDGPEGRGPKLDDISAASAQISAALDESSAVGNQPFTMEVSSRGVSSPLTEEKHFRRNISRLVKLQLADGTETTARIVSVADGAVETEAGTFSFADLRKAVVQVEMNRSTVDDEEESDADLDGDDDSEDEE